MVRPGGRVLLRIPSSYEDAGNPFDLGHTQAATVAWSRDIRFIALDEATHRFIGDLFLVRLSRDRAILLDSPREAILKRTKQPWDRVSIHQPTWESRTRLSLYLHGLLPPPDAIHKEFDVLLRIGRAGHILIEHVRERPHDKA